MSVGPYVHQTPERESLAPAARESSEWRVPESRNSVVISLLDHRSRSDAPDDAAVCTSGRVSGVPKADRRTARTSAGASAFLLPLEGIDTLVRQSPPDARKEPSCPESS